MEKTTLKNELEKYGIKIKKFGTVNRQYLIGTTIEDSILCDETFLKDIILIIIKNKGNFDDAMRLKLQLHMALLGDIL